MTESTAHDAQYNRCAGELAAQQCASMPQPALADEIDRLRKQNSAALDRINELERFALRVADKLGPIAHGNNVLMSLRDRAINVSAARKPLDT